LLSAGSGDRNRSGAQNSSSGTILSRNRLNITRRLGIRL